MQRNNFNEGDYVYFEGYRNTSDELLSSSGIGRIEKFETTFGKNRVYLTLLKKQNNFWCDLNQIHRITTNKVLLKAIGFIEIANNEHTKYHYKGINVSSASLMIESESKLLFTGFCIGDFTNASFNPQKYISQNEFNRNEFHNDFKSVDNINYLFDFLSKNRVQINTEEIMSLYSHPSNDLY